MRITRCVSERFVHFAIIAIPIIPIEPAKDVKIVRAFLVLRLLKLNERAVKKDIETFFTALFGKFDIKTFSENFAQRYGKFLCIAER